MGSTTEEETKMSQKEKEEIIGWSFAAGLLALGFTVAYLLAKLFDIV